MLAGHCDWKLSPTVMSKRVHWNLGRQHCICIVHPSRRHSPRSRDPVSGPPDTAQSASFNRTRIPLRRGPCRSSPGGLGDQLSRHMSGQAAQRTKVHIIVERLLNLLGCMLIVERVLAQNEDGGDVVERLDDRLRDRRLRC
jgi:hypothetical protein